MGWSRLRGRRAETAPKQLGKRLESGQNREKNARVHRIPASRANSLLKYSALWTQPCCRWPASPRRRRAIDAKDVVATSRNIEAARRR
ncbi:hypothetical protein Bxe_A2297 [Paraburkholderia xenovorans LB400]|uniref:Uncharacterized protein n=1 Tax=Paraburkholderia xenovorans (strain LB400) TaxID=266265 RepID=Q13Z17_PARXL|nr:hypothetical protein Bxe_A2297 [Paraburkholderia xenovorans LB400]